MPFIPHTKEDAAAMLDAIGVADIEVLFDEIPKHLRAPPPSAPRAGLSEREMRRRLAERAAQDEMGPCFIGAGCYDHHIPAAVWDLAARGEFMTAYTPYQAEASQGTLQVIYEFQTMLCELTGMDTCNASVYDGGAGLAEAVLMAMRANRKAARAGWPRTVPIAGAVHPLYVQATRSIVRNQGIDVPILPHGDDGRLDFAALDALDTPPVALVVQQPNFFGVLEDVDAIADWAAERGTLLVACVNPLSLALLKPPSAWGGAGADIVCGDGQPLGVPMASGGPSFGFLCTRQALVRQLPGRIVGRTEDLAGQPGFTLTLQAREQHIRRAKATSNICTNQGLLVTAATIHMSLLGAAGLADAATASCANTRALVSALGCPRRFDAPHFHECVIDLGRPAAPVVEALARRRILAGLALGPHFADLGNCLLVCATERRTEAEIAAYATALRKLLEA